MIKKKKKNLLLLAGLALGRGLTGLLVVVLVVTD